MMNKIIFLHSVFDSQNVLFINSVAKYLRKKNYELILVGWDEPGDFNLYPEKIQLPKSLGEFNFVFDENQIKREFQEYRLDLDFLVDRFSWWFPEPKDLNERKQRISFLHYHLHFFLNLLSFQDPILIMIWNGNDPRQYLLNHLCEITNLNRLFLERGTLPSLWFYDRKGVLSNSTVANLNNDELFFNKTNNPRLKEYQSWYFNTSETLWEQPLRKEKIDLRVEFGMRGDQKVILFVGQVDNDIQSKLFSPYFSSNIEALEWFLNKSLNNNYFVLGKHHPKSLIPVSTYQNILQDKKNVAWTDKIKLDESLEIADYVVSVNSSVIFDALMHGKPVLSLGTTMMNGKNILYEYSPDNENRIFKDFYEKINLTEKVENFESLLSFLLNNNLIYFNDSNAAIDFSEKIMNFESLLSRKIECEESVNVLEKYMHNLNKTKNPDIEKKIRDFPFIRIFRKTVKIIKLIFGEK